MGAIIAILTSAAFLIYWGSRAISSASDAAGDLANLPRQLRYAKKAGKAGLDLVEDAREAAAVLMVATARLSGSGRVTDTECEKIEALLVEHMAFPQDDIDDFVTNIRWLTRDLKQPDTVLRPMGNFLQKEISKTEADELSAMLVKIAQSDGEPTQKQTGFILRYREYMGLSS